MGSNRFEIVFVLYFAKLIEAISVLDNSSSINLTSYRVWPHYVKYCKQVLERKNVSYWGPFVNYVSIFLPIFDQVSTLNKHVY